MVNFKSWRSRNKHIDHRSLEVEGTVLLDEHAGPTHPLRGAFTPLLSDPPCWRQYRICQECWSYLAGCEQISGHGGMSWLCRCRAKQSPQCHQIRLRVELRKTFYENRFRVQLRKTSNEKFGDNCCELWWSCCDKVWQSTGKATSSWQLSTYQIEIPKKQWGARSHTSSKNQLVGPISCK